MAARFLGFDRRFAELFFALIPIPPLALGVHGLAFALRLRTASALADRTAAYLTDHLPEGYVVVPHYGPRDGADEEVPMVVIGPPGVVVIEPRDEAGEVLCYEDDWYRKQKYGVGRRYHGQSPSQRARWNAAGARRYLGRPGADTGRRCRRLHERARGGRLELVRARSSRGSRRSSIARQLVPASMSARHLAQTTSPLDKPTIFHNV